MYWPSMRRTTTGWLGLVFNTFSSYYPFLRKLTAACPTAIGSGVIQAAPQNRHSSIVSGLYLAGSGALRYASWNDCADGARRQRRGLI